ncbi:MAG: flagellar export protein FliJ [Chitinispirillaceae bacterium]
MKNFEFRLETYLDVKKRAEEEIKLRLGEMNRQAEEVRVSIQKLHDKLKQFQRSEKEVRRGGEDVASLRCSVAYRHSIKHELLNEGRRLDEVMVQIYSINQQLIKASQERRAVEILKEKQFLEWKKKKNKAEQEFIDELSQQSFIRARAADADSRD